MTFEVHNSSENNVWKYIFYDDQIVLESVLYKYDSFEKRTVICCSVQSGCPVGCTFCGTGKNFIKNISSSQIINQIQTILKDKNIENINRTSEKFQIMFMSMGEPMLNWDEVEKAIIELNHLYPNADLLISTIGVNDDVVFNRIIKLSKKINKIGLQFSIHQSNNTARNILIPFKKKYSLRDIRDRGLLWNAETGRKVYLNYCIDYPTNTNIEDEENLKNLFSPLVFNFTFSVICEADETLKEVSCKNLDNIRTFEQQFINDGYNTRIFDPAGQDDIGGGCGQLWFVQDFLNKKKNK